MRSFFQDGLKTIEHFHAYIEELVVQLGRLKQKQDAERRNLIELRDVLRTFMSSYREVQEAQLLQRDIAAATYLSFWARSPIVHFTEHCICGI